MINSVTIRRKESALLGLLALVALTAPLRAADAAAAKRSPAATAPDAWGIVTPPWLTELSLTVREGYDSNIYGTTSAILPGHPSLANITSAVTTVSPKVTFNLLPLLHPGKGDFFPRSASVTPPTTPSTMRQASRITSKHPHGAGERQVRRLVRLLRQFADRGRRPRRRSVLQHLSARWDTPPRANGAIRFRREAPPCSATTPAGGSHAPVANALYYNLLINEVNPVGVNKGYINWINRDDINAGADFGYKISPDTAFTAGWRVGQQTQARTLFSPAANDSTYNRALFGVEGRPYTWLQVQFIGGPDFRRYGDGPNLGLAGSRHTWFYTESAVTANFLPQDSLTFSNKVWHWVSSGGGTSYQETTDSFTYKHVFTKELSASVGLKIQGARYDAPSVRNDWLNTYPLNLTYTFNRSASLSADYGVAQGRSRIPASVASGRDWDENLVSLSLKISL